MRNIFIVFLTSMLTLSSGFAVAGVGFRTSEDDVFTLYRTAAVKNGNTWRIHVATFDATDGKSYNLENCEVAKALFQSQPGVEVRYWCERGYFKK